MIKVFFLTALLLGPQLTTRSKSIMLDRTTLLAGTSNKAWYLYAHPPEFSNPSCKSSSPMARDNTYTFHTDGSFEFDRGTITRDPSCVEANCCTDFVNMAGTWEFTNNENGILVKALYENDNAADTLNFVLFEGPIVQLDENVLKFNETDPETKTIYSFEFRKR